MARVAMIGENSKKYVNALTDIWNSGDCAVLLDWRIPFSSLLSMMEEANVHRCVIEDACFDNSKNKMATSLITKILFGGMSDDKRTN